MKFKISKSIFDFVIEDAKNSKRENVMQLFDSSYNDGGGSYCILSDLTYQADNIYNIYVRLREVMNSSCLKKSSFEEDLIIMSTLLIDYLFRKKSALSKDELDTAHLAIAQCRFYLGMYDGVEVNLKEIRNVKRYYDIIGHIRYYNKVLRQCSDEKDIKVYTINVSERKYLYEYYHIENIEKYTYANVQIVHFNTFDYCSIEDVINQIAPNSIVFLRGHGNNKEDFFLSATNTSKFERIKSDDLIELVEEKKIKLLAVLTCAHDSFKSVLNYVDHLILPTRSASYLNESIIKTFIRALSVTGDIYEAFDFSQNSVFNYSIDQYTIDIF